MAKKKSKKTVRVHLTLDEDTYELVKKYQEESGIDENSVACRSLIKQRLKQKYPEEMGQQEES